MDSSGKLYTADEVERIDAEARKGLVRVGKSDLSRVMAMTEEERCAYYAWRTGALPRERAEQAQAEGRVHDADRILAAQLKRERKNAARASRG